MKKHVAMFGVICLLFALTSPAFGDSVKLSDFDPAFKSLELTKYNIFLSEKDVKEALKSNKKLEGIIHAGSPITFQSLGNTKYDIPFKKSAVMYASVQWAKYLIDKCNKDIDEYEKTGKGWTMLKDLESNMDKIKTVLNNQKTEAPGLLTLVKSMKPSSDDFTKKIFGKSIPDPTKMVSALSGVKDSITYVSGSVNDLPGVITDFTKLATRFAGLAPGTE